MIRYLSVLPILLVAVVAHASDLSELMPAKIGALDRIELVTGPDAQAEVDELHGKPLPALASVIGRYGVAGAEKSSAEIWVSRVESEKEARRQTGVMVHKMYENPRSPFKNPKRLDHQGVAVYRFTGMGKVHLIWYTSDQVWWVSADPADEGAFLDAVCHPSRAAAVPKS